MDDAKAMTHAGEAVGRAVGSGWQTVRRGAKRAGKAGAEVSMRAAHVAEQKLTERGADPQQLSEAIAEGAAVAREEVAKTTRRARRKLSRTAKHTRKELDKAAKQARKDAEKSKAAKQLRHQAKQFKDDAKKAKGNAKQAKATIKADARRAKEHAKELAAEDMGGGKAKRRRWPKVLGITVLAAAVVYVVRSRMSQTSSEPETVPEPRQEDTAPSGQVRAGRQVRRG